MEVLRVSFYFCNKYARPLCGDLLLVTCDQCHPLQKIKQASEDKQNYLKPVSRQADSARAI